MKPTSLIFFLTLFSVAAFADQQIRSDGMGGWVVEDTGGCGGLWGAAKGSCIAQQQQRNQQQNINSVAIPDYLQSWSAENPWFGIDGPKTEFAIRYKKELSKEHPELTGRLLLDAVSAKVTEVFGGK